MLDLRFLDTAIGLIFIYSVLSLVCAGVGELFAALLNSRERNLHRGVRFLLGEGKLASEGEAPLPLRRAQRWIKNTHLGRLLGYKREDTLTARFFAHPLIKSLRADGKKPSYIPRRSFSLALMSIVWAIEADPKSSSGSQTNATGAPGGAPAATSGVAATPAPAATTAPAATPPGASFGTGIPIPPFAMNAMAGASFAPPVNKFLQELRDNLGSGDRTIPRRLLNDELRCTLSLLLEEAGGEFNKTRANIETWFDDSMESVSGWYKRKSQYFIIVVALFISVAANIDTVYLVKTLWKNRDARDALVAAAPELVKSDAARAELAKLEATLSARPCASPVNQSGRTQLPMGDSPTKPPVNPITNSNTNPFSPQSVRQQNVGGDVAGGVRQEGGGASGNSPASERQNTGEKVDNLSDTLAELKAAGLPIGWEYDKAAAGEIERELRFPGYPWPLGDAAPWAVLAAWGEQIRLHWLGWLITTFALSLGAPFWFDILNKFIVIRSTVKPHEKSPPQTPKDAPNPETDARGQLPNKS